MNLALRKEILNERNNQYHGRNNDILLFFDNISQLLGYRVNSFQQIINIVSELKRVNEKNWPNRHCLKREDCLEDSSSNYMLISQLSAAKSKINSLRCELDHANTVIFKQKNAINELKINNNEYKNIIKDEIRDANLIHTNEIHNEQYIFKLETKNQKLKNIIANQQNEINFLKRQIDMNSNDSCDSEYNYNEQKALKSTKMRIQNHQFDFDDIDSLITQNKKFKMKLNYYKQLVADLRSDNEKLQHQLKIKSECHWSNSTIKDAFRNIQDILGLEPDASPCDTYSAVSSLVCHLHSCM